MKTVALLACGLLAACASTNASDFDHATKNSYEFIGDRDQCQYEAEAATVNMRSPIGSSMQQQSLVQSCLKAKGWRSIQR